MTTATQFRNCVAKLLINFFGLAATLITSDLCTHERDRHETAALTNKERQGGVRAYSVIIKKN